MNTQTTQATPAAIDSTDAGPTTTKALHEIKLKDIPNMLLMQLAEELVHRSVVTLAGNGADVPSWTFVTRAFNPIVYTGGQLDEVQEMQELMERLHIEARDWRTFTQLEYGVFSASSMHVFKNGVPECSRLSPAQRIYGDGVEPATSEEIIEHLLCDYLADRVIAKSKPEYALSLGGTGPMVFEHIFSPVRICNPNKNQSKSQWLTVLEELGFVATLVQTSAENIEVWQIRREHHITGTGQRHKLDWSILVPKDTKDEDKSAAVYQSFAVPALPAEEPSEKNLPDGQRVEQKGIQNTVAAEKLTAADARALTARAQIRLTYERIRQAADVGHRLANVAQLLPETVQHFRDNNFAVSVLSKSAFLWTISWAPSKSEYEELEKCRARLADEASGAMSDGPKDTPADQ